MNNWFRGALATCRFELLRSFTMQRVSASLVLILFPPAMLTLVILAPRNRNDLNGVFNPVLPYVTFAMIFLVGLVCILSLLLWATPNIQSELEGKSWSFIAMRPGGRIACYLGKYITAALTSFVVSLLALTACVLVANRFSTLGSGMEPFYTWAKLAGIYAIACVTYGAIFSMFGTIFIKRAMVVGVVFIIGAETVMSIIPAVISRFTMSYHLRRLGEMWLGWFLPTNKLEHDMVFPAPGPAWYHLTCLFGVALMALIVGGLIIVNRQYITNDES